MTRGMKITLISCISVFVICAVLGWGWILSDKAVKAAEREAEAQAAAMEEVVEPVEVSQPEESSVYEVPPIKIPKKDPKPQKQAEPTNEAERTGQNTGDVSKPEPPPPPEISEEQKKDPTSKPEYTEEQIKPNQQEPKGPQGGEKKDGKIYVPGFGWIEDHGGGNEGGIVGDPNEEFNWTQVGEM